MGLLFLVVGVAGVLSAYTLDTIPEGIPTKQVDRRLEGEDLVCPQCGDTMTEIGKEVVKTLEIIPAQYIVREDIYFTYSASTSRRGSLPP